MSCEVVIRSARAADLEQRSELVRRGFSAYFWDAFLFFFFQESVRGECFGLVAEVRGAGR
ncbi:jg3019, partial [Pararge aegeria aegeria]